MKITIEITTHDLLVFGESNGRVINSTSVAKAALQSAKGNAAPAVEMLRCKLLSNALDIARLTDTKNRGLKK